MEDARSILVVQDCNVAFGVNVTLDESRKVARDLADRHFGQQPEVANALREQLMYSDRAFVPDSNLRSSIQIEEYDDHFGKSWNLQALEAQQGADSTA